MKQNLRFTYTSKLMLCACIFVLCLILTSVMAGIVSSAFGRNGVLPYDINIAIQNVILFAAPAVLCAYLFSPNSSKYLNISTVPSWQAISFVIILFATMTPAFNYLVDWNSSIHLPESMAGVEKVFRDAENNAQAVTEMLLKENNIIVAILLIGVLTGLCEELFFRGMLQKLLFSRPMNIHVAIWTAGFVFSLLHFQFFGFFPRWILGAIFGYMVYWSGSLWTAVIAHALNNSMVILTNDIASTSGGIVIDKIGLPAEGEFPWIALLSLVSTIALIMALPKYIKKSSY